MIGAVADATVEACERLLGPGQTLLLYTDAVVAARPDGTKALRLVAELAEPTETRYPDDDVAVPALTVLSASTREVR